MKAVLTTRAWFELLYVDLVHLGGFRALHRFVSRTRTRGRPSNPSVTPDVVQAVMRACVWYVRTPMCLERSAAVTRLLRSRGVPAEMVVGCHPAPLKGHAWVEVAGDVVSDHMDGLEYFHVLDRW